MQILKLHYKMPLAPQNQTLPKPNTRLTFKLQTTFLPALMEKNGRRNGNVGSQGGFQQCWPECYCFPPASDPPSVQTKLQPTFQTLQCISCSLKRTTQWLKS